MKKKRNVSISPNKRPTGHTKNGPRLNGPNPEKSLEPEISVSGPSRAARISKKTKTDVSFSKTRYLWASYTPSGSLMAGNEPIINLLNDFGNTKSAENLISWIY